ncbi:hypothetical protein NDU88_010231 [Pleurodeles waltl]|uniref:Uncharacterized protein n=1 Tax=Pleurodeles waltl TaxID=8319 RepID=A0AAV7PUC0_PLEWA|nr:hypothetical protein NDU88_010231 [Pleurodeles waltl]
MQTQIRRVAKTCSEFTMRMEEAETRISRLEDDVGSQRMTRETMEKQLEDTQWKLTELEDRLRRNNLQVLGIPEGAEGSDPHGFMIALFKEAFPDLHQWEWGREIQRAHRFPFNRRNAEWPDGGGILNSLDLTPEQMEPDPRSKTTTEGPTATLSEEMTMPEPSHGGDEQEAAGC